MGIIHETSLLLLLKKTRTGMLLESECIASQEFVCGWNKESMRHVGNVLTLV
jgi:hypothetical protein